MWTLICLLLSTTRMVKSYVDNHVSIKLFNGLRHFHQLENTSKFPDVEQLFKVDGKHVKKLAIQNTDILDIDDTHLKKLVNLEKLEIIHNKKLRSVKANLFMWNKKLKYLSLDGNAIDDISPHAINGLFRRASMQGALHISGNNIKLFPRFQGNVPGLTELNIDGNPVEKFLPNQFSSMKSLKYLFVRRTLLKGILGNTFRMNKALHYLSLRDNKHLKYIDDEALVHTSIRILDLSGTPISKLPSKGLENLQKLKITDMPHLFEIPDGIVSIATLRAVKVSGEQRYLCCAFEMRRAQLKTIYKQRRIIDPSKLCPTPQTGVTKSFSREAKLPRKYNLKPYNVSETKTTGIDGSSFGYGFSGGFGGFSDETKGKKSTPSAPDNFFPFAPGIQPVSKLAKHSNSSIICVNQIGKIHVDEFVNVSCTPRPDALHPCDDIMGDTGLTLLSWVVALIGLFANAFVFSVILLTRRTFTVTKFLLQNLSIADLFLSLYLFILVCASTHTHGTYYNYVRKWQYGGGCSIAGFLAIFSSQLSMLVLVVITLERYIAIVYVMRLDFRMSFVQARFGMALAWLIAIIMSILPIFGVNSYNEVAICLPFRTSSKVDLVYIGILLVFNVVMFLFVLCSYIRMYWIVRSPHLDCGRKTSDTDVAKRMALFVFTDFLCWAPIAFVSLMSIFAGPEILDMDVKKSKYLLVIFFPINSICNPFLYATTTNNFKKDVYDIIVRFTKGKGNDGGAYALSTMETGSISLLQLFTTQVRKLSSKEPLLLQKPFKKMTRSVSDTPLVLFKAEQIDPFESFAGRTPKRFENRTFKMDLPNSPTSTPTTELDERENENSDEKVKIRLVRFRSNSDGCILSGSMSPSVKPITFDYDFSPEAFMAARETVAL